MITLLIKEILDKLKKGKAFQTLISHFSLEKFPLNIEGAQPGLYPFILNTLDLKSDKNSLIITSSEKEAESLAQDLSNFFGREVLFFPWWGTAPYREANPGSAVFAARSSVLSRLLTEKENIVVASLRTLLTPLPPPEYFKSRLVRFKKGDPIDIGATARLLQELGYFRVPKVSVKGEFALRGEVIDFFLPQGDEAVRLLILFDEIEEIRKFNPYTQDSIEKVDEVQVFPVRELTFTPERIEALGQGLSELGGDPEKIADLQEAFERNPEKEGGEFYYSLCFPGSFNLTDYTGKDANLFLIEPERLENHYLIMEKEYADLYSHNRKNTSLLPPPECLLLSREKVLEPCPRQIRFSALKAEKVRGERVLLDCEPPRAFFGNINYLKEELSNLIEVGYEIYIFAVYEYQAERLQGMLKEFDVKILPLGIFSGFCLPGARILVISENEIFGRKKRLPTSVKKAKSAAIDSFVDLAPGDYVVHLNYGIGRFKGIERVKTSINEKDYIQLEYDGEEMVFIPIEQVNLIQKYISSGGKPPKLDHIGGKGWDARKARVRKSVEELAGKLVRLYSRRQKQKGYAFPQDTDWQAEFEALFPYQETEDQLKCIKEVKEDMESTLPMDRLVCGDVGYGKTEIALRAAFKGVMGGRQVAVLAPTTILVEQHYENFLERFRNFPVSIGMLSRFRSKKEQKEILAQLAEGKVDIIIGTHRLIQKDVNFKQLGLIIVDEEQRFGVKHKEQLKELKVNVDCLTLTATPIPRTLHMSLVKIRDLSILNTPPQNRMPIETVIEEFDEEIVARAIRREVERGGQVFYLHNRVRTINEVFVFLRKLVPEITIDVAHGKMDGEELEDIMHRFIHNEFQVLISTTIIENGIDIPNVNTIIIDRADMYGISQLYQLRGRVGRSSQVAYAYLLYPKDRALTELAMKRLRIISDYTELGSGFKIAMKDMEIRGAGNLLGREQSGDILAVGFDMYLRLLEEALAELSEEKEEAPLVEVYLELEYSGFIPDSYISDPMEKMEVYKKIAAISDEEELERTCGAILDRFGPMPDSVASIISIAEIRIICRKLAISALKERGGIIEVEFGQLYKISVDKVLRLISESGGKVYLDQHKPNSVFMKVGKIELHEKSEFIRDRLTRLLVNG